MAHSKQKSKENIRKCTQTPFVAVKCWSKDFNWALIAASRLTVKQHQFWKAGTLHPGLVSLFEP